MSCKRIVTALVAMGALPWVHADSGPAANRAIDTRVSVEAESGSTWNPAIDMSEFLRVTLAVAEHRRTRRVSEEDFLRMSQGPGTIVLDARSREKYDELHVKGAINLPFPDITYESLARQIPRKTTRVLIYCNNNFRNAEGPFPTKKASAALNLSTYVALYDYGYRNVYELAPLLNLEASRLRFESSVR